MWWVRRAKAALRLGRATCACRTAATANIESAVPLQEVPGPRCYPVVGSLFDMILDKEFDKENTHLYFTKLFQRYGPVVRVKFPGQPPIVLLHNPEDIMTVFQATMKNPYREPAGSLRKARYEDDYYEKRCGLAAENDDEWQRLSSLLRPIVLRLDNVRHYLAKVDEVTLDFMERISLLRDNNGDINVDFKDELEKWSLESVCVIALNQRLGGLDSSLESGSEPDLVIKAAKNLMTALKECEVGSKLWKLYPTKTYKMLLHSMEKLKETCEGVLSGAESEMKAKLEKDPQAKLSMVEQCLVKPGITRKDTITFMMDLLPGGTETVADMVAVTLYLLAKNPEAQAKLQEEVDRVLGDGGSPLTPHHLDQLSYVKAVLKEANRVLPPMLGPVRTLREDLKLGNHILHKGWMVFLTAAFPSWDAKQFPQPDKFLPERWLRHHPYGKSHPCGSIPFSFGTRMCIGRRIAEQEIYVLLARLFHRYTLDWKHGELERPLRFVFSPKGPMKFTFIER